MKDRHGPMVLLMIAAILTGHLLIGAVLLVGAEILGEMHGQREVKKCAPY